jgi:phosphinothricin acetyltransferase
VGSITPSDDPKTAERRRLTNPGVTITRARESDLPGMLAIYNDVIATSTAVYTEQAATLDERRAWFDAKARDGFPILVAVDDSGVVGFASYGTFRPWSGFDSSVEHSVHVRSDRRRQGIGRRLVSELVELAAAQGKHALIGGVDADNTASIRMHERLGFQVVGRMPEVARKFDRWLTMVLLQRLLEPPR